jgi:NADH:ubiquinone oxidoreductase, NADH-binding (51 kD) subunit
MSLSAVLEKYSQGLDFNPGLDLQTSMCLHDRHLSPQIVAGLDGSNWRLDDYVKRGGYEALKKFCQLARLKKT